MAPLSFPRLATFEAIHDSAIGSRVRRREFAIWLVGNKHQVVWANASATKMTGGSAEGVLVLEDPRWPFVLVREHYLQAQTHLERREWCSPVSNGYLTSGWVAPWLEDGLRLGTICLLRDVPTAGESQLAEVLHTVLDQIPDPVGEGREGRLPAGEPGLRDAVRHHA